MASTFAGRIILYQPGKVGSTAVKHSLLESALDVEVESVHVVSEAGLRSVERWHGELGIELPDYYEEGRRLLAEIRNGDAGRWKVITIFREPVARIVSGFFQEASRIHPHVFPADVDWGYEPVEDYLVEEFNRFDPGTDFTCNWFERELNAVFDTDVYATPFDHDRGFVTVHAPCADILILRFEKLNQCFGEAIAGFLETDQTVPFLRMHETRHKSHSDLYLRVLQEFRLPRETAETIYSTRFARHFFPEPERIALCRRWSGDQDFG